MRTLVFMVLVLIATSAEAFSTIRVNNRIISVGDTVGLVREVAGKPDTVVRLENRRGAAIGERWEYYRDGKTILIEISGGRVRYVEEARN